MKIFVKMLIGYGLFAMVPLGFLISYAGQLKHYLVQACAIGLMVFFSVLALIDVWAEFSVRYLKKKRATDVTE